MKPTPVPDTVATQPCVGVGNFVPEWLENETFAVQYNRGCPARYMVRLIGKGRGTLDMKPHITTPDSRHKLTKDAVGFGDSLAEAAENAFLARAIGACAELRTFTDVKALIEKAPTHKTLCALNDAVEECFVRDQQQLSMSDEDWAEYTRLIKRKVSQLAN